jgi:purine-binding chemotaxis protein CheW
VLEVMRPLPLESIEGAPHFVLGLAVIRGEPLPVVDVAALLSGERSTNVSRFVAVRVGDRHVALAVAEVLGTRTIERQLLGQTPPLLSRAAPGVEALGTLDGALLATLDSARVLDELGVGPRGQA